MSIDEKTKESVLKLQKMYPEKRSALIPSLFLVQKEKGYLPREAQNEVAELFDIDPNEVNSVVTFYEMLFDKPVGKHQILVCKNVSCMLRGSDELLDALCDKLKIKPGETTEDKEFTVVPCECLAACDKAPMILGDEKVFGPLSPEDLDKVLEEIKKQEGNPVPFEVEESHV